MPERIPSANNSFKYDMKQRCLTQTTWPVRVSTLPRSDLKPKASFYDNIATRFTLANQ